jgi:AraC-like DNA-binding protein/CheY-like chemotaxis protein
MDSRQAQRFDLVTEGHHFLLRLLPFREPDSRHALTTFMAAIERSTLGSADIDAVLLRCLVALSEYADRRVPSLVDRYLSRASTPADAPTHFWTCIEDMIKYRSASHGSVQAAINIVSTHYVEPSCTPQLVARHVRVPLATLCVLFKNQIGCTLREHIRNLRLDRAAVLLTATNKSIKEIWAEVGYNHPSNFDHDFKTLFHVTPREYRGRGLRPVAEEVYRPHIPPAAARVPAPSNTTVLIIDGDERSSGIMERVLQLEGYAVSTARTGAEGLRLAELIAPNVILLDYHLDDMNGLEVLQILRGRPDGSGPAVALFTADWDVLDRADAIRALNAVPVSKLCDIERIKETIRGLAA